MKNLLLLIIFVFFYSCNSSEQKNESLRHVGDILFDPKVDTTNFQPCHEDLTFQYYNFSNAIQYEGEKAKIIREFQSKFETTAKEDSGYVTIRFIVNCNGQTGWFRITTMDLAYKPKSLSNKLSNELLDITKELDGWIPGEFNGEKFDYYQYLTFKILNGKIENIMP